MKLLFASAAILALTNGGALAADASVIGDWLVKEGYGHVRIDNCGGKMWGIVSWEKTPGIDNENQDPAKKGRPLLGTPVLYAMAPAKEPGRWTGEVYNSQNGKMYQATISLANENTLDLEGCLVWPLCQTQQWTRVTTPPAGGVSLPPSPQTSKQANLHKKGAPALSDVCARVAAEGGAAGNNPARK